MLDYPHVLSSALSDRRLSILLGVFMKAGPVEIGTLLQNRNRFCVPIYQRHYVWEKLPSGSHSGKMSEQRR